MKTYSDERLQVLGHQGQNAKLTAFVVKGNNPVLLGRDWLSKLKLDWAKILAVRSEAGVGSVTEILEKHARLFLRGMELLTILMPRFI